MISKNISVNIEKDQELPFKETYIIIHNSQKIIGLKQKYINPKKNQTVELNFEECERLMNLLFYYVFNGKYNYTKDTMKIYRE
ncbi:MAG: hypothetical protein ACFFG0_06445 [Candidatus Thorarchaeota archaeon]